ncbi:MAG: response regulator [Clostridiales bacterium]|jgi:CheY-like chemotaxis protein|nr:response regulator [Clostridiales bacterium]
MNGEIMRRIVSKEKLAKFSDLNMEKIEIMTEEQLAAYTDALNTSVTVFPVQKEKIEAAFLERDYAQALQWLKALRNNLSQIHADGFVRDCERCLSQNKDLGKIRHERLGTFFDYFLGMATLFFTDVQNLLEKLEMDEETPENVNKKLSPEEVRQNLMEISELNADKIKVLHGRSLHSYFMLLSDFADSMTDQENALRANLDAKNHNAVLKLLAVVADALSKIHADELFEECRQQIRAHGDIQNIRADKFEIFVNYFISNIEMLVEDINAAGLPKTAAIEGERPREISYKDAMSKNILVLHETKIFFENFRIALDGMGYNLVGVATNKGVVDYLQANKTHLIILDDDIPDVDIFELTRKIRGGGHLMPIIFLTGSIAEDALAKAVAADRAEFIANARQAGATDFIFKPMDTIKAREKIAKILK